METKLLKVPLLTNVFFNILSKSSSNFTLSTKAVFQLFYLQLHIPCIQARRDILSQITFSSLSGTLLHSVAIVACNLIVGKLDVQSLQSV